MKNITLVMSAAILLIACSKSFDSGLNKFEKVGGNGYKVIDTPYKSLRIDTPYKSFRIDTPYKSLKVIDTPYKH